MCGYCDLCGGYLRQGVKTIGTGAETQLCPTGAIKRQFVEEPYFQYTIDEDLCNGCAKCVKGCGDFGNGSLYMQIKQDICVNCNDCSIARTCPSQAISRIPASIGYLQKDKWQKWKRQKVKVKVEVEVKVDVKVKEKALNSPPWRACHA
jgi:electron transport complex protein RnfB